MSRIVHQATNDYLDTFADCVSGRGRPATRGARSIFEHAVNLAWILENPVEAERYVDHGAVGRMLEIAADPPDESRYIGNDRRAFRHLVKKYRKNTESDYAAALNKHGDRFRLGWSTQSLRHRAEGVGLGSDYDSYRLLSAVAHGTAGGDLGQRLERPDGEVVLRTGAALQACPIALRLTLAWFGHVLGSIEKATSAEVIARMQSILDGVVAVLPEHESVCAWIDHLQWPESSVRSEVFLAIDALGTGMWWLRDAEHRKVIRCRTPEMTPAQATGIEAKLAKAPLRDPLDPSTIRIHVIAGFSTPLPNASWLPESTVFPDAVQSPLSFSPTSES